MAAGGSPRDPFDARLRTLEIRRHPDRPAAQRRCTRCRTSFRRIRRCRSPPTAVRRSTQRCASAWPTASKAAGIATKQVEIDGKKGNLLVRLASPDVQVKAADALRSAAGQRLHRRAQPRLHRAGLAGKDRRQADAARPRPAGRRALPDGGGPEGRAGQAPRSHRRRPPRAAARQPRRLRLGRAPSPTTASSPRSRIRPPPRSARAADRHQPADCCSRRCRATPITVQHPAERTAARSPTEAIEQNVGTLRNRINALGVAEPIIQRQGSRPRRRAAAGRAGHRAGQAHPRRHRDAGIPRAWSKATPTTRVDSRQRPGRSARLLPQGERPGRQADADPAEQARDRLGRPAGRRDVRLRLAERHAGGVGAPQQRRRPAHVRVHQRERRQADGGGVHRAHPGSARGRRQGSAQHPRQRGSDLGRDHPRRVRQGLPDHRPGQHQGSRRPRAAAARRFAGRADGLRRRAHRRSEPRQGERRARPDRGACTRSSSRWSSSSSTTACSA